MKSGDADMYAELPEEKIQKIKDLESELGVYLLAEQKFRKLTDSELNTLRETEKSIGAVLVAYEA